MLLRLPAICLLLCLTLPVAAVALGNPQLPVDLEADLLTYDKVSGRYRASGNVQLKQGDMELRSRILWWNQASGEVEAEGDVQLTSPTEKMSGRKVLYNLNSGTGSVEDGYIFLKEQNLHVHGKQIERRGESDYRITEGTFTTCDGEVPSWKFAADQFDVTLNGYAKAKHTTFYLNDIPAFYLPYIAYPIKSDRESGLLMPRTGFSSKRGYQFGGAYYLVIADNQDATFYFDYLSEMGIGKGLEYRYTFGDGNAGEARAYHIAVDSVDGEPVDEQRYALEWLHNGYLPGGIRMAVDAEYVNDDEYFKDFGDIAGEYNKDQVESLLSLSKAWDKFNLVGQFKYTKNLVIEDPRTIQYLPRVSFDVTRQRINDSPFYFALETEYTHFWREEGLRGQRLLLRPVLSASLQLWDVIEVTPEVAYRERYYWGQSDGSASDREGIVEFSTRVDTRFQRVYEQPIGPISKLRHTIEPEVIYRYTPTSVAEQSHLPSYESSDRVAEANRVEYALVTRLTARFDHQGGESSYRDLLYLRLSQSYDLREELQADPFSTIRGQLTLLPTDWSRVIFDVFYDIDQGGWDKFAAEAEVHDQRENSMSVDYRYDRDLLLDYGAIRLRLALLKPVYLRYEKRYDFAANEQLEDLIGVEYRQQCWSAELTYREYRLDQTILLTFTMKGIGAVGGFSGSLGGF
jgi:LPS-assembly protein